MQKITFSPKFGWVNDRFGVSWQLNLTNGQSQNPLELGTWIVEPKVVEYRVPLS